jgi:Na(+)-translocating NADH:ubiquinone oxidoreductase B subunit
MTRKVKELLSQAHAKAEASRYLYVMAPTIEALDTFLFRPVQTTHAAPHLRDHLDLKRMMIFVVLSVAPATLAGIYFYGWKALAIVIVSYAFGLGTEGLVCGIRREVISEGAFVTCILYPLILPVTIPLWMVAVGIVFGILFGKEVFGGTGHNIFNPALVARCFLYICFPTYMTGKVWVAPMLPERAGSFTQWIAGFGRWTGDLDTVTAATPLNAWNDPAVDVFQNYNLGDMFFGFIPGCIGETSKVLILAGGAFLLLSRVGSWRTTLSMILGAAVFSGIMHLVDPVVWPDPVFTVFAGGLLFGAFFMATDPVSSPMLPNSKYVYGVMIGILTVLIRHVSGYPEGVMFAILIMNMFAPILDYIFRRVQYRGAKA